MTARNTSKNVYGVEPVSGRLPCPRCQAPTLIATLNHFGARCEPCYEAYCLEPQPSPDAGDKRSGGPKAGAYALKAREEAGERLSQAQRDMWRAVIGRGAPVSDDEPQP